MHAIVTGHTRGLGQAIAAELLTRGIPVLGLARGGNAELGRRFPEHLRQAPLDLADPAAVQAWLAGGDAARYAAGATALLLINNAGTLGPVAPLGRQNGEALIRAVNLNVTTPLLLSDAVARIYPGPLRIAHIGSGAGRSAIAGWSVYGATKAALDQHACTAAADGSPQLRICSIAPGVVDTDMQTAIRGTPVEDFPLLGQFIALKREGSLSSPAAVATRMIRYLLSDDFGSRATIDLRDLPAG